MKTKISRSSGKVFADLGFGAEEADHPADPFYIDDCRAQHHQ
jgi:hypothetical protein